MYHIVSCIIINLSQILIMSLWNNSTADSPFNSTGYDNLTVSKLRIFFLKNDSVSNITITLSDKQDFFRTLPFRISLEKMLTKECNSIIRPLYSRIYTKFQRNFKSTWCLGNSCVYLHSTTHAVSAYMLHGRKLAKDVSFIPI